MPLSSLQATLALLKQKEFSLYIITRFLVVFAVFMQATCVGYLMYNLTKDPLSLGMIGLAEVIPAFTLALWAGYIVDKSEKRNTYLYCLIGYLVNALLLVWVCSNNFIQTHNVHTVEKLLYSIMFLSGCMRAFLAPASFSLLPLLVKREQITLAVTWSSTSWLLGSVLGPLVAGMIMAYSSIGQSLWMACLCIILAACFIFFIKQKDAKTVRDVGLLEGLRQGFRFLGRSQVLLAVLSLDLFAVLFGGAEALLPIYSKDILQVGAIGYGWLRSAHGIGSIFLLFVLAYLPLKSNVGIKLLLCVAGYGICIIIFGASTYAYLSFAMLFMAGLFDGVSVVIRHSILQLKTPEELKGRISSINMMFISSSNELGAFESGLAAKYLGTVPAVIFGGCMTLLVVIITYFKAPSLRKIKLTPN